MTDVHATALQAIGAAAPLPSAGEAAQAPEWVHLLPAGKFTGRDGRGPWFATNCEEIVRATKTIAGPRQIPIDYEHQTDLAAKNGKPAPAAGWIEGLQVRPDGIWGRVSWTPAAKAHLASKEYRYLSPAFTYKQGGRWLPLCGLHSPTFPTLTL